jgi:carbon monoxide dehydrogenase subunit G
MATIKNTIDIKATPDEVWAVLADMPATRQWLPGVVAARMDGDVRNGQRAASPRENQRHLC